MKVEVIVGDVLDVGSDVILTTVNPTLSVKGGLVGQRYSKGHYDILRELQEQLKEMKNEHAPYGSVFRTSAGKLPFKAIYHCVAISTFFETNADVLRKVLNTALEMAAKEGFASVTLPTLATGSGVRKMQDFGAAIKPLIDGDYGSVSLMAIFVRKDGDKESLDQALGLS